MENQQKSELTIDLTSACTAVECDVCLTPKTPQPCHEARVRHLLKAAADILKENLIRIPKFGSPQQSIELCICELLTTKS